jgi:acyl-CoA reductase-like NAD-dependent aldehyde dehydrogenase
MIQASVTPRTSYSFLIDGSWISEGDPVEIHSPYDHSVVGVTYRASRAQLEQAAQAAARAFQIIRKLPAHERQRILRTVADGIAGRKEEFARVIALEAGKPIKTARQEVDRAILTFSVAAEESTRIYGEYMPLDITASTTGRCGLLRRFPLGPVAAITPFNFPLNLVAHKETIPR